MVFIDSLRENGQKAPSLTPTNLPAAMAHSGAFSSRSFSSPGSPLPITLPNLGAFGSGGSQCEFITILSFLAVFCSFVVTGA